MTKTIEFVEKKIEYTKKKLERLEIDLNFPFRKDAITHLKEDLQTLQQIKCELEAWEEIKKYIVVEEGYVNLYDSYYDIISLKEDCIDEAKNEEEGISVSIIKKALEKKNE